MTGNRQPNLDGANAYIRGINWLHSKVTEELEATGEKLDETLETRVQKVKAEFSEIDILELDNGNHEILNSVVYELSTLFNKFYRGKEKPEGFQSVYFNAPFTMREYRGLWMFEEDSLGQWKHVQTTNEEAGIINGARDKKLYLGKSVLIYGLESQEMTKLRNDISGRVARTILIGPRKYEGVKIQSEQMAREMFAKLEEDYALSSMCELRMITDIRFEIPIYVNLKALPSYKPTMMDRLLKRV